MRGKDRCKVHWCYQETEALFMVLAAIPLIGIYFKRLHARFHAKWKTVCKHDHQCNEQTHAEHPYSPYDKEHWHQPETISAEDAEYLAVGQARLQKARDNWNKGFQVRVETIEHLIEQSSANDIPTPPTWDPISQEDVEERFGKLVIKRLSDRLPKVRLQWFINDHGDLKLDRPSKTLVFSRNVRRDYGIDQ